MNILFITRKYPPAVGGMELFSYELYGALAAKTDVRLMKWSGHGRFKAVVVALPYLFVRSFWAMLRGRSDIIHVNDGLLAPCGYVLSRMFRRPFTVVIHGLDITYKNPLFRAVVPWTVRRADTVFCISRAAADEAVKNGVAEANITVIPLAVRDELYGTSDRAALVEGLSLSKDSRILLTVGRLIKRKGAAWFIDAVLPGLVKDYPHLIYLVVGDGPDRPDIESAIARHRLDKHVHLTGRLSDELRAAAYNGADMFVMPNISVQDDMEGFGLVLLEASLCKLPVVAAGIEGIKDAIADGKNGILVPEQDASAFDRTIRKFLDDRRYAKQFGEQSRRYTLDHYRWPVIADKIIDQYEHLQSGRQNT